MSDTINRQAAIDAVEFGITYAKAINKSTGEVKELFKEGNKALNEAVERLKELPSAEPKTPSNGSITSINSENTHDRTMGDLISRKDAIDAIISLTNCDTVDELRAYVEEYDLGTMWSGGVLESIEKVEQLSFAEPELIRCKDCKHYAPEVGDDSYALGYCPFIGSHLVMSKGFCAWGEKRGDSK